MTILKQNRTFWVRFNLGDDFIFFGRKNNAKIFAYNLDLKFPYCLNCNEKF